jgi:hypothetical protein
LFCASVVFRTYFSTTKYIVHLDVPLRSYLYIVAAR